MTKLVTGDLHLTDNPRDEYRFGFFKSLPKLVKEHDADTLVILGDLTEEKDYHGAWLVNRIVDGIAACAREARVIIVCGNHDYVDAANPFYRFLVHVEGVWFINTPTRLSRDWYLPHTINWKRDWEGLDMQGVRYAFAHNTFTGANVGFGRQLDGIPPDVLGDVPIISGDIHVPQTFANITYVGAPYRVDFGDDYNPRMLLIPSKGQPQSIRIKGREKRLVEVDSVAGLDDVKAFAAGDVVKLRIHVRAADAANWASLRTKARDWALGHGLVVHSVEPVMEKHDKTKLRARAKARRQSDSELFDGYAADNGLTPATIKTGKRIMEAV